jgi:hypothetical protein
VSTSTPAVDIRIAAAAMMSAAIRKMRTSKQLAHALIASTPVGDAIAELANLPSGTWPIAAQTMKLRADGWVYLYHVTVTRIPNHTPARHGEMHDEAIMIECCTPLGAVCCYVQPFERNDDGDPIFTRAPYFLENGSHRSQILGMPPSAMTSPMSR